MVNNMYMFSYLFLVATGYIFQSQCEIYSLNYIYTALSKPVELPGIHEFTAMGLMNDRQIDYYDSDVKQKIPRQDWMKEKLPPDYWEKGTQSRKSKEQWFKVNVNILMERMKHNNTDPPKIYGFAKKAKTKGQLQLTCMATGFYPKDVEMQIRKNGVPLTKYDGVHSEGVLPNNDDTYQIRMSVQIPEADTHDYECHVDHRTLKEPIRKKWDGKCCDCGPNIGIFIGAVGLVVLLLFLLILILWKTNNICIRRQTFKDQKPQDPQNGQTLHNVYSEGGVKQNMLPNGSG